ncbi:MAG TPA: HNH endonuclease signature motif containing protein [Acidimicrobiales bacterium]|nr:HNH endonuclease signature motif containing protein [Acidimicrobiales bacterium]
MESPRVRSDAYADADPTGVRSKGRCHTSASRDGGADGSGAEQNGGYELGIDPLTSPGSLVPWLDQAWLERVVFDPASRIIDVGVARRLSTGATRRAVQVRDQECFHPLCDEPAELCQIDHVEPWSAGGHTVAANGRPACAYHTANGTDDRSRRSGWAAALRLAGRLDRRR